MLSHEKFKAACFTLIRIANCNCDHRYSGCNRHPAVYLGLCGLSAKGGNYDGSGNLRMICNMGQEDEDTRFSTCDLNVF